MEAGQWTETQQHALEVAIKAHPQSSGLTDRWGTIADCVPEKTKSDCVARVKKIKRAMTSKRSEANQAQLANPWEQQACDVVHTAGELDIREGGGWRCLYRNAACDSAVLLRDGSPCHSHIAFSQHQILILLASTWLRTLHYDRSARQDRAASLKLTPPKVLMLGRLQWELLMAPSSSTLSGRAVESCAVTVLDPDPDILRVTRRYFGLDLPTGCLGGNDDGADASDGDETTTIQMISEESFSELVDDAMVDDFRLITVDSAFSTSAEFLSKLVSVLPSDKPSLVLTDLRPQSALHKLVQKCYAQHFDYVYNVSNKATGAVVVAAFVNIQLEVEVGREEAYINALFSVVAKGDRAIEDTITGAADSQFDIRRVEFLGV